MRWKASLTDARLNTVMPASASDVGRFAFRPLPSAVIMIIASFMLTTLTIPIVLWYCITDFTGTSMGSFAALPWMIPTIMLTVATWHNILPLKNAGNISTNGLGIVLAFASAVCAPLQVVFLWYGIVNGATDAPLDTFLINQQANDSMATYIVMLIGFPGVEVASVIAGIAYVVQFVAMLFSGVIGGVFADVPLVGRIAPKILKYIP